METQVEFLEVLEQDLEAAAERERAAVSRSAPSRRSVRWKSWLGAAAALVVLAFIIGGIAELGGGTAASKFSTVGAAVNGDHAPAAPLPAASPGAKTPDLNQNGSRGPGASTDLTKIIRDGTIAMSVPDGSFETRLARVVAIAHTNGGFVLSSQTQDSNAGTLTIRVPAAHFDTALGQVGELGTVESSSVTGKDVTNQFIDYQAHLQNLIGRRTVLRTLLAKTTTIGESLTVENELQDVQLSIDQIQGQLRYLKNQVAESTLTVDLHEASVPAGSGETNGGITNPSLSRAWDRAIQGFFGIIATIIVGLGYLLPLAVIAAIVYGVVTLVRRRGREAS
jgi:hypothetical protein